MRESFIPNRIIKICGSREFFTHKMTSVDLIPSSDEWTDLKIDGESISADGRRINRPVFTLPAPRDSEPRVLRADEAIWHRATAGRGEGYLLRGIRDQAEFFAEGAIDSAGFTRGSAATSASAAEPSDRFDPESILVYAPGEAPGTGPDECFVLCGVPPNFLAVGEEWRSYASTPWLIDALQSSSLPFKPDDLQRQIHRRIMKPISDLFLSSWRCRSSLSTKTATLTSGASSRRSSPPLTWGDLLNQFHGARDFFPDLQCFSADDLLPSGGTPSFQKIRRLLSERGSVPQSPRLTPSNERRNKGRTFEVAAFGRPNPESFRADLTGKSSGTVCSRTICSSGREPAAKENRPTTHRDRSEKRTIGLLIKGLCPVSSRTPNTGAASFRWRLERIKKITRRPSGISKKIKSGAFLFLPGSDRPNPV